MTRTVVRNVTVAMMPNVRVGDYLVIDRNYYSNYAIERFDMVVVKSPRMTQDASGKEILVVKRVVGLAGERLQIHEGRLFVDSSEMKEPFSTIPNETSEEFATYIIPHGQYFLLGDNRPNSEDSRHWEGHSVDKSFIVAKVTEVIHSSD